MKSFSHRSVNLRGSLTVAIAMLIVLDHALQQPNVIWFKVVIAMILAGAVAARAFMDQSLSMRDKSPDATPSNVAPPVVDSPAVAAKVAVATDTYPFN